MTTQSHELDSAQPWRQFICRACGLIYDEEQGDPDSGLAPGTRFEDIPDDWECPLCGVTKIDFEPFERQQVSINTAPLTFNQQTGIVVLGAGLAGWSVVEELRRLDQQVAITLVTACSGDRYHKPELSVACSRGADAETLIRENAIEAARRLGIQLLADTWAVGLSPALKQLRTTRGSLNYTRLVIAQGAKPSLPEQLPAALCWRINDLAGWNGLQQALQQSLRQEPSSCQQIAIVGAGMIGCELAEDFARAGHQVTLIDRNSMPLSGLLPAPAANRLVASLEALGIRYLANSSVAAVSEQPEGRKQVRLQDGQLLSVNQVVAATGLMADNRLARQAGLAFDNGLVVNEASLQTSDNDIYALGDCISIAGSPCRFIEPIQHQAKTIAHHALGLEQIDYQHTAPVIRLKTRSLPIVFHGQPCADADGWTLVHQDEHQLIMEQYQQDQMICRLQVGSSAQSQAA